MRMYFKETAQQFLSTGKTLLPFHPFPPAAEREQYDRLPLHLRQEVVHMGESCLGYRYPAVRATDFMAFRRLGNRTDYEDIYFSRRHALNSLAAAECIEHQGRFLDDVINGIFALCEESAWQLPAHNTYQRGGEADPLPDSSRPVLDLFACETGAQLACIHYLLKEELDAVSPVITGRIRRELEKRILIPYLNEHFWWMGTGKEPLCNWTPWCTQNVLLTVFFCTFYHSSAEISRSVLCKAAESCDYFLKDYGEDGCCDEGAHYYRHAGLCLDGAFTVLNQITDGAFAPLMHSAKIKNMAAYIYHVHVDDKYYFNFADCSPLAGRAGVREYLFGKHTGQPELMQFAAKDFVRSEKEGLFEDESQKLSLFYRLQTLFHYDEIRSFAPSGPIRHRDIFYPSTGLFLARSRSFSLAVKAGGNDDSHNHNDTGSVTLYKNGKPVLVDIGVESYTDKTFSSRRYEIWTMQSGYHNLPAIEGLDQHDGPDFHADNVVTSLDGDAAEITIPGQNREEAFISMELSGAYPLPDPKPSYRRKVVLDKNTDCVTLTDTTVCQNVILNFITYARPQTSTDHIQIGNAEATFRGAELLALETLPITDKRLQLAWDHDLYRIQLKMTDSTFTMQIR